ncbi:membrane protein [Pseudomonas aeruginosa]|nr:membrane protein [Pseudomonas aeruginosa]
MSEGKDPADGRPSLRRFGAAFLGLLHGHVELFGIELQEQKANTLRLLLFAGLALVFALLLLVGLSLLVLIVFWDTNRLAAALGLCLFYRDRLAVLRLAPVPVDQRRKLAVQRHPGRTGQRPRATAAMTRKRA